MNGLRLALSFLTTLPTVTAGYTYEERHWKTAVFWFPLIGGLIGGLVWLTGWGAAHLFSSWLAATLAVTLWAVITGGLHLDGLADCCDGLLAPVEPARRLEIMRDPRVGAFATVGLILFLGLKTAVVQELLIADKGIWLMVAAMLGRTAVLWVARQPAARAGGMGAVFAEQLRPIVLFSAILSPAIGLLWLGWPSLLAVVAGVTTTAAIILLARQRIGGVTGDVYGLTVELVELAVLLAVTGQVHYG